MFIFSLTYVKPLSEVERFLPEHIQFLDEHYKSICSFAPAVKCQERAVSFCVIAEIPKMQRTLWKKTLFIEKELQTMK